MKQKIKCKFCESEDVSVTPILGSSTIMSIRCSNCGSTGPLANNKKDAVALYSGEKTIIPFQHL